MVGYSVYETKNAKSLSIEKVDNLVFIKEGFAWIAIFSPLLWSLYHKLWNISLVVFCLSVLIFGLAIMLGLNPLQIIMFVMIFNIIFAFEANTLRQWQAKEDGLKFAGFVSGDNKYACQRRFFESWLSKA